MNPTLRIKVYALHLKLSSSTPAGTSTVWNMTWELRSGASVRLNSHSHLQLQIPVVMILGVQTPKVSLPNTSVLDENASDAPPMMGSPISVNESSPTCGVVIEP